MMKLLDWFIKEYPSGGITLTLFKQFFPATETGQNIASLVFRSVCCHLLDVRQDIIILLAWYSGQYVDRCCMLGRTL